MTAKTPAEIDELRQIPGALEAYILAEQRAVFGHDVKHDGDGNPIEQGIGSWEQPSQNSIDAYIKTQTERRVGGPEPDFQENLEAMRARLAEYQAAQRAKTAGKNKLGPKVMAAVAAVQAVPVELQSPRKKTGWPKGKPRKPKPAPAAESAA